MSHLLDTNAFADHLRGGPKSKVATRLASAPLGSVYLCSVVLAELLYGAARGGHAHEAKNRNQIAHLPRTPSKSSKRFLSNISIGKEG